MSAPAFYAVPEAILHNGDPEAGFPLPFVLYRPDATAPYNPSGQQTDHRKERRTTTAGGILRRKTVPPYRLRQAEESFRRRDRGTDAFGRIDVVTARQRQDAFFAAFRRSLAVRPPEDPHGYRNRGLPYGKGRLVIERTKKESETVLKRSRLEVGTCGFEPQTSCLSSRRSKPTELCPL